MAHSPDALLTEIESTLEDAEAQIRDGYDFDLKGIEQKIAAVCQEVTALPQDKAKGYRPRLETLIAHLEAVEKALKGQQAEVLSKIDEVNLRRKAASAYKTTAASAKDKDKKES